MSQLSLLGAGSSGAGDATAPTIQSAIISADGETLTIVLSEVVNGHSGFTLTPSGGAAGLTYSSGDGTDTLVFAIDRVIYDTETATGDYAPGDVEDLSGNALEASAGFAVTNNSAQTWTPPASCVLWLESNYGLYQERSGPSTPANADNDPVGTWQDQSGNGNHFTAASDGERPYLDTSGAFPVIQWDGIDDKLTAGSSVTVKHWVMVCMYHAATFNGFDGLLTGVTSGAEQIVLIGYDGTSRWYDDVGTVLNGATYTLNGTSYAQGNRQAPMNAQGLISVSDSTGWNITPQLGDDRDIAGRHWSGCLTALFGFSTVLSAEDLSSVVTYLNNKYSIY